MQTNSAAKQEGIFRAIVLTDHAIDRVKERMGLKKNAAERMARKALVLGLRSEDVAGEVAGYISSKEIAGDGVFVRIYGEYAYVFGHNKKQEACVLITVYRLPSAITKRVLKQQKKLKNPNASVNALVNGLLSI